MWGLLIQELTSRKTRQTRTAQLWENIVPSFNSIVSESTPSSGPHGTRGAARPVGGEARLYRAFGVSVSSELSLPELFAGSDSDPVVDVRLAADGIGERDRFITCHEWREGGEVTCRVARGGAGYLLSFPGVDFLVAAGGRIVCAPLPGVGEDQVRHLLLNQVLPRYLAHTGALVLHASAVTFPDGRTLAFLGEAGHGKSTLAYYCHGRGARLVDDDCVLLRFSERGVSICGGVPTVRLRNASLVALRADPAAFAPLAGRTDKRQMRLEHAAPGRAAPVSLDAVCLLDSGASGATDGTVRIEPATGRAAVMGLVNSAFNLDPSARDTMTRTFRHVSRLAGEVPVCQLHYPRKYDLLPRVWEALQTHPGW